MNELQTWDYQESIQRVKPMVVKWRSLTVELVDELYRAREALDGRGKNRGNQNVTDVTFSRYLDDVGLNRMTVHRWLERYEPEERRILEPEEVEERKRIADRAAQDEAVAIQKRINEYRHTGRKPKDWDDKTEHELHRKEKEERERAERLEAFQQEQKEREESQRTKRDRAEQEEREREAKRERRRIENELLNEAAQEISKRQNKRREFKERIKLSQAGGSDQFIEALMDYLEELEDDNRRIEACYNIVKVAKGIAVELQRGAK